MIFYSFSGPDDMEIVILREYSQFALLPWPILHAHKPEIMELGQSGNRRLLEQCLPGPRFELRPVCASNHRVIKERRCEDIAWRRKCHLPLSPRGCKEIELHVQPIDCPTGSPSRGTRATHIRQRHTHGFFDGQPFAGKNPTPE